MSNFIVPLEFLKGRGSNYEFDYEFAQTERLERIVELLEQIKNKLESPTSTKWAKGETA